MIAAVTILVLLHALVNWYIIVRMKQQPNHFAQGGIYVAACGVLLFWFPWWPMASIALTARAALLDPALNIMRGFSWLFNGRTTAVPHRKQSITDWLENKTKIPVLYFRIGYLIAFSLNIFFIWKNLL